MLLTHSRARASGPGRADRTSGSRHRRAGARELARDQEVLLGDPVGTELAQALRRYRPPRNQDSKAIGLIARLARGMTGYGWGF